MRTAADQEELMATTAATARAAAAIIATAGLALLAAACGGSLGSHGVQLGSTTTQPASSSDSSNPEDSRTPSRSPSLTACVSWRAELPRPQQQRIVTEKPVEHRGGPFVAKVRTCARSVFAS